MEPRKIRKNSKEFKNVLANAHNVTAHDKFNGYAPQPAENDAPARNVELYGKSKFTQLFQERDGSYILNVAASGFFRFNA